MKAVRIIFLALFAFSVSHAQKPFEGKVTFAIKLLGDAGMMGAFMPESYEYSFKDGDMLFQMNGGVTASLLGDILIKGKEGTGYMIRHSEKTIYKIESTGGQKEKPADTKVVKTGETENILGYDCTKYKVTTKTGDNEITQYMWVTKDLNLKMPKKSSEMPSGNNLFIEGVEGFPLKVQATIPMVNATMVMTATEVKEENLDKALFKVPADYQVKAFDPKSLMGF